MSKRQVEALIEDFMWPADDSDDDATSWEDASTRIFLEQLIEE